MADEPQVIIEKRGRAGLFTLNRPKALNAVTADMVARMHPQLAEWAGDPAIDVVIVRANGEKAFSAGGDIRQLHDWGRQGSPAMRAFYHDEYRLNAFIRTCPKPYVALIDGIVMGGGVGVSMHGSHRAVGERLMFAMPETGIGFFPDVGGTYFLPRLPGRVGTWLALTSARLGQADALWAGLGTHAVPGDRFDSVTEALAGGGDPGAVLAAHAGEPAAAPTLPVLRPVIDRCFAGETVEAILAALDAETGEHAAWAQKQAAAIRARSPTSLKIALRQMQEGAKADFEECMRIEYRIVSRIEKGHDFYEGVRAVIIDKDNAPRWQPPSLDAVSDADIDAYFAPLPDELDLSCLDRR